MKELGFANGIAFLFRSRVFRCSHYYPTCIEQEENREYRERKGREKNVRETVTNVKRNEGKRVEFKIRDVPR